jgi:hypothetical protein
MIHYAWVIALTGTLVLLLSLGFGRLSYSGWIKDATGNFTWCFILSAAASLLGAAGATMLRKKEPEL